MALNPQFMISPNLQEYFVDKTSGLPLTGGNVFYYKDNERSTLKTVYTLSGSFGSYTFLALPNPVPLSGVGTPTDGSGNDIRIYYYPYDENGNVENYYAVVKDANGLTQITRQAWPNLDDDAPLTPSYTYNFVRNASFYAWGNTTLYTNVKTGSINYYDFITDDWSYRQDDGSQTINISRGSFAAGDDFVPGNPPYFLIYENSNASSGVGTYNQFQQYYKSVQTLNSKNVAISIWIKQVSGALGNFSVTLTQHFGSGGSSDVVTTVISSALVLGEWLNLTGSVELPSITGKSIGTQGDDFLILSLNMPINQTALIDIGPIRLEEGTSITGNQEISNDDTTKNTNFNTLYPPFTTGDVKFTIKTIADIGWLMLDDTTIGNLNSNSAHIGFSYYGLYSLLWNNIHSPTWLPIYDSAGALTTYGNTAKLDWDANKRLSLTKQLGYVLAGANPAATGTSRVFTASNDGGAILLTISAVPTTGYYTGVQVTFTSSGTLPGNLSAGTQYWLSLISESPTVSTLKVANSLANAIAGNWIAFSSAGTGTHNVIISLDTLGSYRGEFTHTLIIAELATHSHPTTGGDFLLSGAGAVSIGGSATAERAARTGAEGGGAAHNITQPTTFLNAMIKL